jgi:hypothetical protein
MMYFSSETNRSLRINFSGHKRMRLTLKWEATKPAAKSFLQQQVLWTR